MNKYNEYYDELLNKLKICSSNIAFNKQILSNLQKDYNLEKRNVSLMWSNIYDTYQLTREECESLKKGTYTYSDFGVIKKSDFEFYYRHRSNMNKIKSVYDEYVLKNRKLKKERKFILDIMNLVNIYKD